MIGPIFVAIMIAIVTFGMLLAIATVYFWLDERNRRIEYARKEQFAALRYVRVSDTIPDAPIPSMAQTVKGKL